MEGLMVGLVGVRRNGIRVIRVIWRPVIRAHCSVSQSERSVVDRCSETLTADLKTEK